MSASYNQIAGLVTSLGLDPAIDCRIVRDKNGGFIIEPGSWGSRLPEPTADDAAAFEPSPLPDIVASLKASVLRRQDVVDKLKATVLLAMIAHAGFTQESGLSEGAAFFSDHGADIYAYVSGGSPKLLASVQADSRQWLGASTGSGAILDLFKVALS